MSYLRQQCVELLQKQGIHAPFYRTEKLRSRICKHFHGSVGFWHPQYRSQAEVIYSDEVPKGAFVEAAILAS